MSFINTVAGFLGDALLRWFASPWIALCVAALATAMLTLLIVRWTSSAARVERARNRLLARVLELVLFRHDFSLSLTATGRILAANGAYLRTLLVPLAVSMIPCLLILSQLAGWFEYRPLRVGEVAVVEVALRDGADVVHSPVSVSGEVAVVVETQPVRVPRLSEVAWRVRGVQEGSDRLEIRYGAEPPVVKTVDVSERFQKVSRSRPPPAIWDQFLFPVESPVESGNTVRRVDVRYPARELLIGSRAVHWLAAFLVLTIAFALLLKRPMGVRI